MRILIKRLEIWSVVKIVFLLSLILGFIFSLLYAGFIMVMSSFMGAIGGEDITPMLPASGLLAILIIFGGTISFAFFYTISALIFSSLYNIFSRMVGGFTIEAEQLDKDLDVVSQTYILDQDNKE